MNDRHRSTSSRARIGILGGSFNPVHVGHLALGQAAVQAFGLDRLIILPTGQSWQKAGMDHASVSATHRLAMMQIAVRPLAEQPAPGGCEWLVDDLEATRDGASYTVETLQTLRQRIGADPALILILGSDQLRNLATWHRWRELLDHGHIAATQRETVTLSDLPDAVEQLVHQHGRQVLPDAPAGSIVFFQMPPVAVSATALRRQVAGGVYPQELLPPGVADYIRLHRLYEH